MLIGWMSLVMLWQSTIRKQKNGAFALPFHGAISAGILLRSKIAFYSKAGELKGKRWRECGVSES